MQTRILFIIISTLLLTGLVGCGRRAALEDDRSDGGRDGCECIPIAHLVPFSDHCGCPYQVRWGCKGSPKLYNGSCDRQPWCWGTETDPDTGCLKPALLCWDSCWDDLLADLLGDAGAEPAPDAGTDTDR
jgi:hypothetical protein